MDFQRVLTHLKARLPGLMGAYLFGSQADGHADAQSDLDMAVLVSGTLDPVELWRLSGEIADIVNCPVDLIDLRAASTVMQYQVITKGKRLWAKDEFAGIFEAFLLSEKTALDAARAGLIKDIQEKGIVHGR
ncbi:nucleotidyltransferase domain-containing protein [Pseudomonas alliivorans]|uniref:type VII toxin-antitoxin system MntA family adenylyltransferase antitoxin n=1 Tax=Pseudomonas alliivorans TaxID=2810613 RepID=UPI00211BD053|nr:nucleotidyltransferase domain-containing protein [Pseudomonas alliivorans]MCQ9469568.1 nucleotidyltransferase domain-containing protein [Pseudomonas alliivorans]